MTETLTAMFCVFDVLFTFRLFRNQILALEFVERDERFSLFHPMFAYLPLSRYTAINSQQLIVFLPYLRTYGRGMFQLIIFVQEGSPDTRAIARRA
jgi:hypothetical protein